MKKGFILLLLILFSCQKDEIIIEPTPTQEMIFEESISKVVDGQEFSFEVTSTDTHQLIIKNNNSVLTKESFTPIIGLNTKTLYTTSLPKGELNLSLVNDSLEIQKTVIIIE